MSRYIKNHGTLVSSTTLTGSYVASDVESSEDYNEVSLYINFTPAEASTTLDVKVEGSNDGSTFYRLTTSSVSSGTDTRSLRSIQRASLGAATSDKFSVSIPITHRYLRISYKESSVSSTYGTVAVDYFMKSKV